MSGVSQAVERNELRELLVGTWVALALVAEMLIDSSVIARGDLERVLTVAEFGAPDQRRAALAGVRRMIETLGGDTIIPVGETNYGERNGQSPGH